MILSVTLLPKYSRDLQAGQLETFNQKQDNVYTNTESVQCISIVYSICPYDYNQ